jgi:hypothetical protein
MAIHLGRPLPDASCDRPGRRRGNSLRRREPACRPYLVLLPVGFTVPPPLPATRCALTAPFHPYRQARRPTCVPRPAVCFLWHYPWGRPRRALPGTVFPWSPDFPPPFDAGPNGSGHPAVWHFSLWGRAPAFQSSSPSFDGHDRHKASSPLSRRTVPKSIRPSTRSGRKWRWKAAIAAKRSSVA